MNVKLILEGLNCANCAGKIERYSNEIEGVEARLNFTTKELSLDIQGDSEEVIKKVKKIVKELEPDVEVKLKNSKEKNIKKKSNFKEELKKPKNVQVIIGIAFFISGLLYSTLKPVGLILFIIAYILIGRDVVTKAFKNLLGGRVFDENFLMTIATLGAFVIGEYPEAVAVMLFYKVGEAMQGIAVNKSRSSIADLMDINPEFANIFISGIEKKVSPEKVKVGDIIIIKPGEKIPLDGIIIEGKSSLNTVALTGESIPRDVFENDKVLSGFINQTGVLKVKVEKEFGESTVSKILDLVENASSKKSKAENFITKFARYYTPVVVLIAFLMCLVPPFITGEEFSVWIYKGLSFLVVSCPCALVISIPLSYFGGIGGASRKGILVKGANYLDVLKDVDTVVFDKTGTLTKGNFKVTNVKAYGKYSEKEVLMYCAYGESSSNHPIAKSILEHFKEDINKEKVKSYKEISGKGISAKIDGQDVLLGNSKLMKDNNIEFIEQESIGTNIYIAINNEFAGCIVISDEIKEDAISGINKIKSIGIKETVMLTGDNKEVANNIAGKLKIDSVYADLLPQNKVEIFEEICKNKKAAFVGDGINDAPVLARADVGIAMGGLGSDAAIEAADVVIMTDEISKISEAVKISKFTFKIVIENIVLALGIKLIVLALVTIGLSTMWEAVFADVGVTLLAVLNSMRVLKLK